MNHLLMILITISLLFTSCTTEFPELPVYEHSFSADSLAGVIGSDTVTFKQGNYNKGNLLVQGSIFDIEFTGNAPDTSAIKRSRYAITFSIPLDSSVHNLSEWNTSVTLYSVLSQPIDIDSGAVQIVSIDKEAKRMIAQIDMKQGAIRLNGTFSLPITN